MATTPNMPVLTPAYVVTCNPDWVVVPNIDRVRLALSRPVSYVTWTEVVQVVAEIIGWMNPPMNPIRLEAAAIKWATRYDSELQYFDSIDPPPRFWV